MTPDISEQIKVGLSHHQRGQLQRAQSIYRSILAEQPNHVDALHLLGVLSLQVGNGEAAVELIEKAIRLKPDEPEFHNMCGEAYRALGKYDLAIACYERAIKIKPEFAGAYANLGSALKEVGRLQDAVGHLEQAIAFDPASPMAHNNLGVALKDLGRPVDAIGHLRRALDLAPDYAEAHTNLGNALQESGRPDEAIGQHRRALGIRPDFAEAHGNLGNALRRLGRLEEAVACYQRATALQPGFAVAHYNLGIALNEMGAHDEAVASYRRALDIAPQHAQAHHNLGNALSEMGLRAEAIRHYQQAIAINPDYAEAHRNLTRVAPDRGDPLMLEKLLATPALSSIDEIHCRFALGHTYDHVKAYDDAFRHFNAGNALKRKSINYRSTIFSDYVDRLIAVFSQKYFRELAGHGSDSEVPVFVVGMPRSGTSLVEQIIATHPEVYGAGELACVGRIEQGFAWHLSAAMAYPECMAGCAQKWLRHFADYYLNALPGQAPHASRITDKMPDNFLRLGLIRSLFPRARIIHCRRNPMDTCVSNYLNYFATGNEYSFDFTELGKFYLDYQRLMTHWGEVLSTGFFVVDYEDLVGNQERVSRELFAYLGLAWDDRCLDFHQNPRAVNTFSSLQVRQPIYAHAIDRCRRYEKHLAPLLKLLADANWTAARD